MIARATWKYLEPKDWLNFRADRRCAATYDSIVLHWVTDNRDLGPRSTTTPSCCGSSRSSTAPSCPISCAATSVRRVRSPNAAAAELGVPAGHRRGRRHPRPAVGGDRLGRRARLRRPPLRRYVVVADVSRPVQEDRPLPRHRVAAVAAARQVLRRRRAGGRGRLSGMAARPHASRPATISDSSMPARAARVRAREQRGDLHAVAQRRANPGRRPHAARRDGTTSRSPRPARSWSARCSKASRTTAAGCSRPSRSSSADRFRGCTSSAAERSRSCGARSWPTCCRPRDPPGRASDPGERAGAALVAGIALGRIGVDDLARNVRYRGDLHARSRERGDLRRAVRRVPGAPQTDQSKDEEAWPPTNLNPAPASPTFTPPAPT